MYRIEGMSFERALADIKRRVDGEREASLGQEVQMQPLRQDKLVPSKVVVYGLTSTGIPDFVKFHGYDLEQQIRIEGELCASTGTGKYQLQIG